MFGIPVTWIAIVVMAVGLAGSGWFILHQAEQKGILAAQLATVTAASEANAQLWKDERADRERAQRIAARRQQRINELEAAASAREESTYNVAPEDNGPIARVLRRELDRLPEPAPGGAAGAGAAAGDRPRLPHSDTGPDAARP